jgi:hypothetical protein
LAAEWDDWNKEQIKPIGNFYQRMGSFMLAMLAAV